MVLGGRCLHRTIHGEEPLAAGDALVLMPGRWHAYERCRGLRLANVLFASDALHRQLAWAVAEPALAGLLDSHVGISRVRLDRGSVARVHEHAEALRALVNGPAPLRHAADQIGRVLLVLGELSRAADAQVAGEPPHPAVVAAMRLMDGDLAHPWGLPELGERCQLDRSYLVRLFRRRAGSSPMRWLARRRCEHVAVRLLTTHLPVAAIGREVGWDDANYLARRFRAVMGQTPSDYRRQLPRPAVTGALVDDWIQW